MKNRIRELRVAAGWTQGELSQKVHISNSMLSHWEHERFDIPPDALRDLARVFDVSVDYLIYNDNVKRRQSVYGYANIRPLTTKKVPLLGRIACGEPIYTAEQFGEMVDVPLGIQCDFCLTAAGDSMTGARILDGDLVFCRQSEMVDNGKIAAVVIGQDETEATLKRWYYYPAEERIVLVAENPAYPPMVYHGAEIAEVRVLGEAVAFQSLVR